MPDLRAKLQTALGAMVLAHKEHVVAKSTQKELSRARFAGDHPFPLPGPGVFAAGDSIARGALLPDGSISKESLAPTLQGAALRFTVWLALVMISAFSSFTLQAGWICFKRAMEPATWGEDIEVPLKDTP